MWQKMGTSVDAHTMPACKKILKDLRLEARLSLSKLARKADLDRNTASAAESGRVVQELTVSKIVSVLSRELGRPVKVADVTKG